MTKNNQFNNQERRNKCKRKRNQPKSYNGTIENVILLIDC